MSKTQRARLGGAWEPHRGVLRDAADGEAADDVARQARCVAHVDRHREVADGVSSAGSASSQREQRQQQCRAVGMRHRSGSLPATVPGSDWTSRKPTQLCLCSRRQQAWYNVPGTESP